MTRRPVSLSFRADLSWTIPLGDCPQALDSLRPTESLSWATNLWLA